MVLVLYWTDRIPCCCRQQQSGADSPFMYGRSTVDLILVVGSLVDLLDVGVNVVQSARHGSLFSFHSVTCTKHSIRAFENKDSCKFQVPAPNPALQSGEIST